MTLADDSAPPTISLREPAHRVSSRAPSYWRATSAIGDLVFLVAGVVLFVFLPVRPWWAITIFVVLLLLALLQTAVMPVIRYRVHRWEVSPIAVHTRSGWIGRHTRIAPINRVQTVDSRQGAIMRLFGLATLTVTTASAAGPITIDCLDADTARDLVAQLTEITAATEGDAT